MAYQKLVEQLTPQIYATFKGALELGKWPDGSPVTASQKEHCMQAIIAYDQLHTPESQRVGYIDTGNKQGQQAPATIKWQGEGHE
jgi:uncharacterized protein YeaC (DUF1315 family)